MTPSGSGRTLKINRLSEAAMAEKLNLMDQFPDIELTSSTGEQIRLPADIDTDYAVVLFYRGHW